MRSFLESVSIRGRYAPSPTGRLHLGNLRTALLAWLFARKSGGGFVLRIEDLDQPRTVPGAAGKIIEDLQWLGIDWDEGPDVGGPFAPYTQSERIDIYQEQMEKLTEAGLTYECFCSRADIAQSASAPQEGASSVVRYSGSCRNLSRSERSRLIAEGKRSSIRFCSPDRVIEFPDILTGKQAQNVAESVGDFIIRRSDGIFAYQFTVVVDDALMQMNQVVRGCDLLDSTARQIALFQALGYPAPMYAHVPLMQDEKGRRLAKRDRDHSLDSFRDKGYSAEQITGMLAASCGLIESGRNISLNELLNLEHFLISS